MWEEDFATVEDQQIIDDLRDRLRLLGLDPSQAEEMINNARVAPLRKRPPSEPFPVQPQRQWEEAKRRLYEQGKRLAKLLLNHVGLDMAGTELIYRYKSLNLSGRNNYVGAVMMVNAEINKRLGKDRTQATTEDIKYVLDDLDDVLRTISRRIRKAISEYEKNQT